MKTTAALAVILLSGCAGLEEQQDRQERQAAMADKANPIIRAKFESICDTQKSPPFQGFGVPALGQFNTYLRVPCVTKDSKNVVLWFDFKGNLERVLIK